MTEQWFVEIVRYRNPTDEVVKRMGPMSRTKAEKVDDGANINLNHELFYTRIVGPMQETKGHD